MYNFKSNDEILFFLISFMNFWNIIHHTSLSVKAKEIVLEQKLMQVK